MLVPQRHVLVPFLGEVGPFLRDVGPPLRLLRQKILKEGDLS